MSGEWEIRSKSLDRKIGILQIIFSERKSREIWAESPTASVRICAKESRNAQIKSIYIFYLTNCKIITDYGFGRQLLQ